MLIFPSLLIVLSLRDFCSLFFSRLPERMKLKSGSLMCLNTLGLSFLSHRKFILELSHGDILYIVGDSFD